MRTPQEIKEQMLHWSKSDFIGVMRSDLLEFLPYEHAKILLKEGVTAEQWNEVYKAPTDETVKAKMIDYMEFAWTKANGCRGISAARSMQHYKVWTWLLGSEVYTRFHDLEDYEFYGKDNLVKLCEFLGLDAKQWDDGHRVNSE
jgi:hypothetical protein